VKPAHGIIVSGASTGIGQATVALLARRGYVAFAGVRNESDAARLRAAHENIRPLFLDVTDESSIARAAGDVEASGIPLLGVVSNAGIALGGPLERLPIAELRRQFEVNVFGSLALVQTALPLLGEGSGRIVLVGSISGRLATPYVGAYSASKFALRAMADALRIELSPSRIAVSLIEPGSVKTPIWKKGRETAAEMATRLENTIRPHYRVALERMLAIAKSQERDGMPVEVVATAILHALTAAKPRANYLLGARARMGGLFALLPAAVRDRAVRKSMRIP
jgi:NAD(P)-dependent dehydrogenase (short-subunit alcohol dehydrogenase family)